MIASAKKLKQQLLLVVKKLENVIHVRTFQTDGNRDKTNNKHYMYECKIFFKLRAVYYQL